MKILDLNNFIGEKMKIIPISNNDFEKISDAPVEKKTKCKPSDYYDRDVYSVVTQNGKKQLKLEYYFFEEETIECVEFTGCYLDIPATMGDVAKAEENCKQYQSTFTENEYIDYCADTLDKLEFLNIENVTLDTPEGTYIT